MVSRASLNALVGRKISVYAGIRTSEHPAPSLIAKQTVHPGTFAKQTHKLPSVWSELNFYILGTYMDLML